VLVVDSGDVVRMTYVTLGQAFNGLRVIKAGLQQDDRIIINGLMRARPNQKVNPQNETPPAAIPGSPPSQDRFELIPGQNGLRKSNAHLAFFH
jgi:membrane fusion protein, multidrug efflux system